MATTISQIYRRVWLRRLVKRHRRHGAEALTSRTVRSPRHHSLPAAGLERCHCLRLPRICHSQLEPMASRDRGRPLLARHAFSCLAAPALSQRDLAWFCIARDKLSLFGGPRLLALGITGKSCGTWSRYLKGQVWTPLRGSQNRRNIRHREDTHENRGHIY